MLAVAESLGELPGGSPLVVPRPVDGLVTDRVLVMDYVPGVPLSQLAKEAAEAGRGGDAGGGLRSRAKRLMGRRLLRALTDSYGKMLLVDGYFHGDPHPGNIILMPDGRVSLIDFGQMKRLTERTRVQLASTLVKLYECGVSSCGFEELAGACKTLGVRFKESCPDDVVAAGASLASLRAPRGAPPRRRG